jgi:hypothetical protein
MNVVYVRVTTALVLMNVAYLMATTALVTLSNTIVFDQAAQTGITLEQKINNFLRTFSRFSKTIVKILVDCQK